MAKSKRVVVMGDTHCGHVAGLCPPNWIGSMPNLKRFHRFCDLQEQCWKWFAKTIKALQPIDILLFNGDAIDGRGERSGGLELVEPDRAGQCEMAVQIIKHVNAKRVAMTYGTAYHTGQEEDWEAQIAAEVGASIGSHEWPEINGVVFDMKHHLGSSSVPHGRHTAVSRDRLWNMLWAERGEQPKGDVFIRSHVHYHQHCGDPTYLAMTLPALQAAATKYGARRCSGIVDYGLVHFDIDAKGGFTWQSHLAKLPAQKAQTLKL